MKSQKRFKTKKKKVIRTKSTTSFSLGKMRYPELENPVSAPESIQQAL